MEEHSQQLYVGLLTYPGHFALLKVGQQVTIEAEAAYDPETELLNPNQITDFVFYVAGNSILTNQGWAMGGCHAAGLVSTTGQMAGEGDQPTDKAKRILEAALSS